MAKKKTKEEALNEFEQAERESSNAGANDESDVKRPTLTGEPKPKKQKNFTSPADDNMSTIVHDEDHE